MAEIKIVKGEKFQIDFIVGAERLKHQKNIRNALKTHGKEVKTEIPGYRQIAETLSRTTGDHFC